MFYQYIYDCFAAPEQGSTFSIWKSHQAAAVANGSKQTQKWHQSGVQGLVVFVQCVWLEADIVKKNLISMLSHVFETGEDLKSSHVESVRALKLISAACQFSLLSTA